MIGVRAATTQPAGCSDLGRRLGALAAVLLAVAARLREEGANVHRVEDRVMPRSVNVVETLGRYIGTFVTGLMGVDDP